MGNRYIYRANLLRFLQVKKLLFIKNHNDFGQNCANPWLSVNYPIFLLLSPINLPL
jgi:hypothetical protein